MRTLLAAALLAATAAHAQLPADTEANIAAAAQKALHDTGVPSVSIGIVQHGKIVYTHAFGLAQLQPATPAAAAMAYPIGSISKQFTATAILLLQQEGKLSIDDPVGKYFPELTRANDVKLRNLMTMTSGYEDFAPQDYIIPAWKKPIAPIDNVHEWAEKPLDFEPGTQWQYSNTNYVLLGLVVEKVSGEPLGKFIRERVLDPLHLQGVFNTYTQREKLQVLGYVSYAMATPRVQPLEAPGWYFGDGDLAMPAATLLAWDLGIMNKSLLSPASYAEFETAYKLQNGTSSGYGLGTFVREKDGHRELEHSGEVGGYVAENVVYPDDGLAIVALTNEVASSAASEVVNAITPLLLPAAAPVVEASADPFVAQLKTILSGLQHSQIDRSLFTSDTNDYFNQDALSDFQSTLSPLGTITDITRTRTALRGGMTFGLYRVAFSGGTTLLVDVYLKPDGKIEQLLVVGKA
ncbi:serine hydrolase [Granulicella mallensis]|uniref:CubicO group peptidase (Beta-lactamase class C family) n=1 Tax=Granulicella mallensis TaxID=940614 RepID=A0A7W7ZQ17_9BACT|nr:serine hydrolase domain-containing protein [Granulicella mallensis]MBB5063968.1 CubicO group peptidase (beta-lactamase class C family) [Granulicella mallensis]